MQDVTVVRGDGFTRYSVNMVYGPWGRTLFEAWVRDGETVPYAYAAECAPADRSEMPPVLLAALPFDSSDPRYLAASTGHVSA